MRRRSDVCSRARLIPSRQRPTAPTRPREEPEAYDPENSVKTVEDGSFPEQRHRNRAGTEPNRNHRDRPRSVAEVPIA